MKTSFHFRPLSQSKVYNSCDSFALLFEVYLFPLRVVIVAYSFTFRKRQSSFQFSVRSPVSLARRSRSGHREF